MAKEALDGVVCVILREWHAPITCREKPPMADRSRFHHPSRTPAPHPANTSPNNGRRNRRCSNWKRGEQHGKAHEHKQWKPVIHNMESKGIWQWKGKKEKQTLWQNKSWLAVSKRVSVCFGASLLEHECVEEEGRSEDSNQWGGLGPGALPRLTGPLTRQ